MSEKLCERLDFSVIKAAAALNGSFGLFLYLCTKMFRLKARIILILVFQQSLYKPVCVCVRWQICYVITIIPATSFAPKVNFGLKHNQLTIYVAAGCLGTILKCWAGEVNDTDDGTVVQCRKKKPWATMRMVYDL